MVGCRVIWDASFKKWSNIGLTPTLGVKIPLFENKQNINYSSNQKMNLVNKFRRIISFLLPKNGILRNWAYVFCYLFFNKNVPYSQLELSKIKKKLSLTGNPKCWNLYLISCIFWLLIVPRFKKWLHNFCSIFIEKIFYYFTNSILEQREHGCFSWQEKSFRFWIFEWLR